MRLRFRKNPLKLQINSSSLEIRSGGFFFLEKLPKGDTVFEKGNILSQITFKKYHQIDDRKQFFSGDGVTTFLCTATVFKSSLETSSQSSQNLTPWDACHADSMKKLEKRHRTVDGD